MLDHIVLNVRNFEASKRFYDSALTPLGWGVVMGFPKLCGYGHDGKPYLWIAERDEASAPVHVALSRSDRPTVDAFHEAALSAGGRDNGAPGVRTDYHKHYYGAFVHDPDGNNIEAVCHRPQ